MFGKLRLIKRDVLGFCSIMLLRLALAISVAKIMHDAKSFFVDTFKYDFKEKPIFWTYPLFFKRHQWFQIGLWTENKLTFQKPRFCNEIFFFHYYFSFTLTRILELRVARHIPVYERVNPKNELKILETRTTFIAKRQTLLTDAMSPCLKNVTYV